MKDLTDEIMSHQSIGEKFIVSALDAKKLYDSVYTDFMEKYDLTQNEIDVLLFLYKNKDYDTSRDIAEYYYHISRSLISKSVDTLSRKNLLYITQDEHDRRFAHLNLSTSAVGLVRQLHESEKRFYQILQKDISQEELEVFISVLRKIRDNIRKEVEKNG